MKKIQYKVQYIYIYICIYIYNVSSNNLFAETKHSQCLMRNVSMMSHIMLYVTKTANSEDRSKWISVIVWKI